MFLSNPQYLWLVSVGDSETCLYQTLWGTWHIVSLRTTLIIMWQNLWVELIMLALLKILIENCAYYTQSIDRVCRWWIFRNRNTSNYSYNCSIYKKKNCLTIAMVLKGSDYLFIRWGMQRHKPVWIQWEGKEGRILVWPTAMDLEEIRFVSYNCLSVIFLSTEVSTNAKKFILSCLLFCVLLCRCLPIQNVNK
jgi:hypothetical protein